MLQFIKKWHQAFKEDKAVRLVAEEDNARQKISTSTFWDSWSDAEDSYYEEQRNKGNYY
ncbi:hypothetical protein [Vibrio scophthalmi]|uniref:Uncharacterized protein n=1 Tax=Vibrio scophthalmi TaxID=45658 RepID=A0A1C7FJ64_9VIBR|nr:hypothetical protein [Vibrio scophthalmi]ANU39364.1 hypothetical protein VSVS05_04329 [Vibrio scophthalmi]